MYEDSENIKADRVNTASRFLLTSNQTSGVLLGHPVLLIKRRYIFGTLDMVSLYLNNSFKFEQSKTKIKNCSPTNYHQKYGKMFFKHSSNLEK